MLRVILLILTVSWVICQPVLGYENSIYIWQRVWHPELLESINQIKSESHHFLVLGGDFNNTGNRISFSRTPVNWTYLKDAGEVTVDIRMRSALAKNLQNENITGFAEHFKRSVSEIIHQAKVSEVNIQGIQIDYDCPTAKLADFTRLVKEIKKKMPDMPLSITALPTWMYSKDFLPLISATDYYVMQLHSFEIPKETKNQTIFPKDKAMGYFQQAVSFHRPFYLSLPTYGYEVAFSKDSEFLGLKAESGVQFYGNRIQRKTLYTDPHEIVEFLTSIEKSRTDYFRGVCWFRLPVTTDSYNWDIKTLQRVLNRKFPQGHLTISISMTPKGVEEIYVINDGEINFTNEISFDVFWNGEKPVYDILGNFDYSELSNGKRIHITGNAPRVSQRKMVGWFRSPSNHVLTISNSEVKFNEK